MLYVCIVVLEECMGGGNSRKGENKKNAKKIIGEHFHLLLQWDWTKNKNALKKSLSHFTGKLHLDTSHTLYGNNLLEQ